MSRANGHTVELAYNRDRKVNGEFNDTSAHAQKCGVHVRMTTTLPY